MNTDSSERDGFNTKDICWEKYKNYGAYMEECYKAFINGPKGARVNMQYVAMDAARSARRRKRKALRSVTSTGTQTQNSDMACKATQIRKAVDVSSTGDTSQARNMRETGVPAESFGKPPNDYLIALAGGATPSSSSLSATTKVNFTEEIIGRVKERK